MDLCKMFPSMVAAVVARVERKEYKSPRLEVDDNELKLSLALAILVSHTLIEPCSDFVVVVLMYFLNAKVELLHNLLSLRYLATISKSLHLKAGFKDYSFILRVSPFHLKWFTASKKRALDSL